MFLWRVCNDILPTKEKLFRRKIVPDLGCPKCGKEAESNGHLLWWCDASKAVWAECSQRIQKCTIKEEYFLTIFGKLSDRLEQEDLELVAMVTQKIWLRRNRVVFGEPVMPPSCLLKSAIESLDDFQKVQATTRTPPQDHPNNHTQWSNPLPERIKMNWNAALDRRNKLTGVGLIARDH